MRRVMEEGFSVVSINPKMGQGDRGIERRAESILLQLFPVVMFTAMGIM